MVKRRQQQIWEGCFYRPGAHLCGSSLVALSWDMELGQLGSQSHHLQSLSRNDMSKMTQAHRSGVTHPAWFKCMADLPEWGMFTLCFKERIFHVTVEKAFVVADATDACSLVPASWCPAHISAHAGPTSNWQHLKTFAGGFFFFWTHRSTWRRLVVPENYHSQGSPRAMTSWSWWVYGLAVPSLIWENSEMCVL